MNGFKTFSIEMSAGSQQRVRGLFSFIGVLFRVPGAVVSFIPIRKWKAFPFPRPVCLDYRNLVRLTGFGTQACRGAHTGGLI